MRNVSFATALALVALAGCTGNTDNPPLGQSTSTTATATTTTAGSSSAPTTLSSPTTDSAPPSLPPQVSAAPLEGGPTEIPQAQVDHGTLPYEPQARTSADGRTVQVIGQGGGCRTARGEVTAQSGDQVLITIVNITYTPPTGTLCSLESRDVPVNVTLDAPLGSRRLVLEVREETA